MKLVSICFILILCSVSSWAQVDTARLRNQARLVVKATVLQDAATLVKYSHPNVVKSMGGAAKMEEALNKGFKAYNEKKVKFSSIRLGEISQITNAGNEIHALIAQTTVMKMDAQYLKLNSWLLAISSDKGRNWTFTDVIGLRKNGAKAMFPNFNPALKIPPMQTPQFSQTPL